MSKNILKEYRKYKLKVGVLYNLTNLSVTVHKKNTIKCLGELSRTFLGIYKDIIQKKKKKIIHI